jgi:AraC family transcriptional regulator
MREESVDLASERVGHLLRQAMIFLDLDRQAARQCLQDASALLDWDAGAGALPANDSAGGLARWQGKRALAYIEANLGAKVDVCALANAVSLSKSHFARAFRRSFGLSPMAYVVSRRVEQAKVMMTSTTKQLAEIALACGFVDQSHLNRAFRRLFGVSPGRWRRTNTEIVKSGTHHEPTPRVKETYI